MLRRLARNVLNMRKHKSLIQVEIGIGSNCHQVGVESSLDLDLLKRNYIGYAMLIEDLFKDLFVAILRRLQLKRGSKQQLKGDVGCRWWERHVRREATKLPSARHIPYEPGLVQAWGWRSMKIILRDDIWSLQPNWARLSPPDVARAQICFQPQIPTFFTTTRSTGFLSSSLLTEFARSIYYL